ncbi:hypothetical protein K461DRAFT_312266 [Myriangium duriaei CBS 260.36]|uniref:Biogenesis of lysosome-related organelles complex 1 subunit 1 n=1 Tax=Myriangium duriaei CBS 260.36 TaxID=1168546 RepID=A0A9P4MII7_9PEZI|nr:hypothetical protein K461DRAFT_312266 [Myriangium duriaei CBS 260.36]
MSDHMDTTRRPSAACSSAMAKLDSVASSHRADIESRASVLNASEKAVCKQDKQLRKNTETLAKQNEQCEKLVDATYKALTEFGDVQNWAEMIERDLLILEETMRLVDGLPESENISGT